MWIFCTFDPSPRHHHSRNANVMVSPLCVWIWVVAISLIPDDTLALISIGIKKNCGIATFIPVPFVGEQTSSWFRTNRMTRYCDTSSMEKHRISLCSTKIESEIPIHSYYLATTIPGMSETLQNELVDLGCVDVERSGTAGVTFAVEKIETIYSVLVWSRVAHKIMELLAESKRLLRTRSDVYKFVQQSIPVRDLLMDSNGNWMTLSVSTTLNNPRCIPKDINHSHFTALNVKNALVDSARLEDDGSRPSVDTEDADVPLVVVLRGIPPDQPNGATGAQLSIYRSIHNGSLHRRGYRSGSAVHKAGLKESMSAGLLMMAGWPGPNTNLLDPMMGSGTFLIEAAMMASDYAPGLMRLKCNVPGSKIPPIVRWGQHGGGSDQRLWQEVLLEASARAKRGRTNLETMTLAGNDVHLGAVQLADQAIRKSGFSKLIHISEVNCRDWKNVPLTNDKGSFFIVCNPPWGERLTADIEDSWTSLRIFLRDICPEGTTAWILSGNAKVTQTLKLRRSQSIPLQTGQQQLRWLEYNIGLSRKASVVRKDLENTVTAEE